MQTDWSLISEALSQLPSCHCSTTSSGKVVRPWKHVRDHSLSCHAPILSSKCVSDSRLNLAINGSVKSQEVFHMLLISLCSVKIMSLEDLIIASGDMEWLRGFISGSSFLSSFCSSQTTSTNSTSKFSQLLENCSGVTHVTLS